MFLDRRKCREIIALRDWESCRCAAKSIFKPAKSIFEQGQSKKIACWLLQRVIKVSQNSLQRPFGYFVFSMRFVEQNIKLALSAAFNCIDHMIFIGCVTNSKKAT